MRHLKNIISILSLFFVALMSVACIRDHEDSTPTIVSHSYFKANSSKGGIIKHVHMTIRTEKQFDFEEFLIALYTYIKKDLDFDIRVFF